LWGAGLRFDSTLTPLRGGTGVTRGQNPAGSERAERQPSWVRSAPGSLGHPRGVELIGIRISSARRVTFDGPGPPTSRRRQRGRPRTQPGRRPAATSHRRSSPPVAIRGQTSCSGSWRWLPCAARAAADACACSPPSRSGSAPAWPCQRGAPAGIEPASRPDRCMPGVRSPERRRGPRARVSTRVRSGHPSRVGRRRPTTSGRRRPTQVAPFRPRRAPVDPTIGRRIDDQLSRRVAPAGGTPQGPKSSGTGPDPPRPPGSTWRRATGPRIENAA